MCLIRTNMWSNIRIISVVWMKKENYLIWSYCWNSTFLFLSLSPEMKRLAYITAVILSLLIIYSGAGVSIVHYYCSRCEAVQGCCANGCPKCKKSHTCDSKKDCREKGCTATIYKLDLMKHVSALTVSVPVVTLFCEQSCQLFAFASIDQTADYSSLPFPPPPCPRQKLALHSVLLI